MNRTASSIRSEIAALEDRMQYADSFRQSARDRQRISELARELREIEGAPEFNAPRVSESVKIDKVARKKAIGEAVDKYFDNLRAREKHLKKISQKRNELYRDQ